MKPWNYKGITDQIKNCCDCNKQIKWHATRCNSCAQKYRLLTKGKPKGFGVIGFGNDHPRWKGIKKELPNCLDCGKELSKSHCKKCAKCSYKDRIGRKGVQRFGKDNPNYKHGKGNLGYPPEFNDTLRDKIRSRDNYECQGIGCTITQEEHIQMWSRSIEVHHIDHIRTNCQESNLITLCKSCNVRANTNKEFWQDYYTKKVTENVPR